MVRIMKRLVFVFVGESAHVLEVGADNGIEVLHIRGEEQVTLDPDFLEAQF